VEENLEPEVLQVLVPAFIVQPLVENAISHGMRAEGPLTIRLFSATDEDGSIRITVADDGAGIPAQRLPHVLEAASAKGLGIALKNVDDRLKGNYGPGSGVVVESIEGRGATVSLVLVGTAQGARGRRRSPGPVGAALPAG
jgi:two-component system sensor histidine kinase LytS